ncbi:MAG: hypothetical protein K0Q75_1731 [Anaerospora sp.]|nr:hypothetical protein [Anaerospora sp.]
MFALNFQAPHHEELLLSRAKNCTIRLGDVQETYPENSIVWITFGKKFGPRKKLYPNDYVSVIYFSEIIDN